MIKKMCHICLAVFRDIKTWSTLKSQSEKDCTKQIANKSLHNKLKNPMEQQNLEVRQRRIHSSKTPSPSPSSRTLTRRVPGESSSDDHHKDQQEHCSDATICRRESATSNLSTTSKTLAQLTLSAATSESKHKDVLRTEDKQAFSTSTSIFIAQLVAGIALVILTMLLVGLLPHSKIGARLPQGLRIGTSGKGEGGVSECAQTCRIEIIESMAQNLSFNGPFTQSTANVWLRLVSEAKHSLVIAAYKSSLRGKHVLDTSTCGHNYSHAGEMIYDALKHAGLERKVQIRMVENGPAKDRGDNEDGRSLHRLGAITRRKLNLQKIFDSGIMHSKFIVADGRDFYMGSANLDWRSLNQKMEMGIYVRDCPCLAQDLLSMFEVYWQAAEADNISEIQKILKKQSPAQFNAAKPLKLRGKRLGDIYLAASPKFLNSADRTWDLDAIVGAINSAKSRIRIHVMDYFPIFMYSQNQRYWPAIDDALRAAIIRGVDVKIIAAALHFPDMGLRFLKSMEQIGEIPDSGSIEVRIFKVPSAEDTQMVIKRDRRTHKKFMVTDDTVVIGTSNWSGDYFSTNGTGVAIVIRNSSEMVDRMEQLFQRDWESPYAHPLDRYIDHCLAPRTGGALETFICEEEKDESLLADRSS